LPCSQSGDDPKEDLARFAYNLNMKVFFTKKAFFLIGYLLEPCIEIWRYFFNFWSTSGYIRKHLILALLIFNIASWPYIYPAKKKGSWRGGANSAKKDEKMMQIKCRGKTFYSQRKHPVRGGEQSGESKCRERCQAPIQSMRQ
jgi:hypothetical protein